MDLAKLKNEITKGPLAEQLAELFLNAQDQAVADRLNARTSTAAQPIPIFEFAMWAARTGVRAKLRAGLSSDNPAIADICDVALEVMHNPHATSLDPTDAGTVAMMTALVGAGVVSQEDVDGLKAYCTRAASRADLVFGFGSIVTAVDVGAAR